MKYLYNWKSFSSVQTIKYAILTKFSTTKKYVGCALT